MLSAEYRNNLDPAHPQIKKYLSQLENIPGHLQEIIAREAEIVFFNGKITDNRELQFLRGIKPERWNEGTWDKAPGCYLLLHPSSRRRLIFACIENGDSLHSEVFLHELGHGYDDIIGRHFFASYLSETKIVQAAAKIESFRDRYYHDPQEYVANSVEMFYKSSQSRSRLKKYPAIFELLTELHHWS